MAGVAVEPVGCGTVFERVQTGSNNGKRALPDPWRSASGKGGSYSSRATRRIYGEERKAMLRRFHAGTPHAKQPSPTNPHGGAGVNLGRREASTAWAGVNVA